MEQAIASRGGNPDAGAVVAEDPLVEFENALRRRVPAPPHLIELAAVHELRRLRDVAVEAEDVVVGSAVAAQAEEADLDELPQAALAEVLADLRPHGDGKRGVQGKEVSVRVEHGGRRSIKKKKSKM